MMRMIPRILGFVVGLGLLSCAPAEHNDSSKKFSDRPNIVLIFADDLGYGEVEALNPGRSRIPTPHINRLAKEGMAFTDAHTSSSVCTPSRYALLTGRYNWRTRLQEGVVTGGGTPLIAKDRLTVPALLKKGGYGTAMVGKWHLDHLYEVPPELKNAIPKKRSNHFMPAPYPIGTKIIGGPITRGFDSYYGFHHSREMSSLVRNDKIVEETNVEEILPKLTKEVVSLIDEKAEDAKNGKPFFIYFAQNSPHTPIAPTYEWKGKTELGDYGDFVAQTDGSVGAILEALYRNGLYENTIVIFTSDNGTSRAADIPSLQEKGHYPSANLRGSKADLWDGGHRVPFIVRWPGVVKSGVTNNALICLSDLMATFAELIDEEVPENAGEDSWSFLPTLLGNYNNRQRKSIVHHSINGRFSIRQGNYKLMMAPGSGGWTSPTDIIAKEKGLPDYQLYQLENDIGEEVNIVKEEKEKVESLIVLLEKFIKEGRSTSGTPQSNDVKVDIYKTQRNFKK